MLRYILAIVLLLAGSAVKADSASAQDEGRRVALVIGNANYVNAPPLENPRNDAEDIAGALEAVGFEVIKGFDLDRAGMDRTLRDFARTLPGASVGLFFYAGHGLQVSGHNYMMPIDAELSTAAALDFEMVRMDLVQRVMEREIPSNVIFIDACRNNPLARNLARALGTRSIEIGRGLASIESGRGTLISFSTQPGNVALDGTGRNSPFAKALLKHMHAPGEDLSNILIRVRNDVMSETAGKQVPWEHSALTSRIFLSARPQGTGVHVAQAAPPPAAVPRQPPQSGPAAPVAMRAAPFDGRWRMVRQSPNCGKKSERFETGIRNSKMITRRGEGSVDASGKFVYRGKGDVPGEFSYIGQLSANAGKGDYLFINTLRNFKCGGTFTMTRIGD